MNQTEAQAEKLLDDWFSSTESGHPDSTSVGFTNEEWDRVVTAIAAALTEAYERGRRDGVQELTMAKTQAIRGQGEGEK